MKTKITAIIWGIPLFLVCLFIGLVFACVLTIELVGQLWRAEKTIRELLSMTIEEMDQ